MTPQQRQQAITNALGILKPAPEQREACRQDIAHVLDQLDREPDISPYKRMLKRGKFLRKAAQINRTLADGDNTMALPQSLLDELVEKDKELRGIHKTRSPDQWRKKQAVFATFFLLLRWRPKVEHSPQEGMVLWTIEGLSSTKGKPWSRLSSILYGKLTKDGKPADLRRQMRQILRFNTTFADSHHVPVRTVTAWIVGNRRSTLFVDGRKPK
jgi:hypothetical protein